MPRNQSTFLIAILLVAGLGAAATPSRDAVSGSTRFTAVAHAVNGASADGSKSRTGTVAADPKVLPLGSKIHVSGAGAYSGDYTVIDSGGRIKGNVIDIYMSSVREARTFGRRHVDVRILKKGRSRL